VTAGSPVSWSIVATGGSLAYQWLKDDLEIPQATGAILTIEAASLDDAGTYRVRVRNGGGLALSDPASLTVTAPLAPPIFTSTPQDITLHEGEPLLLTSAASGTGNLTFAWTRNEQPLAEFTTANLILAKTRAEDGGTYNVSVSGTGGTRTSPPATVTIFPTLALTVPSLSSGGLALPFNGIPGRTYVLESARQISSTEWHTLQELVAGPVSVFPITELAAEVGIYRIRTK